MDNRYQKRWTICRRILNDLEVPNDDLPIEGTYIGRKKITGYISFLLITLAAVPLMHTVKEHNI